MKMLKVDQIQLLVFDCHNRKNHKPNPGLVGLVVCRKKHN